MDGSHPYGLPLSDEASEPHTVAFQHERYPCVLIVVLNPSGALLEAAWSVSGCLSKSDLDACAEDCTQFLAEAQAGEAGQLLPFDFLPRRVARRVLRRLDRAHH